MQYSTDRINWDGSSISGITIYFRGIGNSQVFTDIDITSGANWSLKGSNVKCSGNIESLLDYTTALSGQHPKMSEYCFCLMFFNQIALIEAPRMPSSVLSDFCYVC